MGLSDLEYLIMKRIAVMNEALGGVENSKSADMVSEKTISEKTISFGSRASSVLTVVALTLISLGVFFTSAVQAKFDESAVTDALKSGDTTSAIASLTSSVENDKKDYKAQYWLGRIAYAQGKYVDAKKYFARTYELKKKFYPGLYFLAMTHMHLAEFDKAAPLVRKGLKKARTMRIEFNGARDSIKVMQDNYDRTGNPAGVTETSGADEHAPIAYKQLTEEELKEKIAQTPKDPINYFKLGKMYYDSTRYEDAKAQLQAALAQKPDHDLSNYLLGLTMLKLGDIDGAKTVFSRRIEANESYKAEYNNGLGMVLLAQAKKVKAEGGPKEVIDSLAAESDAKLRIAVAYDPNNPKFHLTLAEANFLRGVYAAAKSEYELALEMSPGGDIETLRNFAEACYVMKDYACALEQFGNVLKTDTLNAHAWRRVGSIYFGAASGATTAEVATENYKNTIAAYRKYIELTNNAIDSSTAQVYYDLAESLAKLKGYPEAVANYERVLSIPVVPDEIYLDIARGYSVMQEWEKAIKYYDLHSKWALEQGADYTPSMSSVELDRRIGEAYYGLKDNAAAIPYLQRSYAADTSQTRLLINIALGYHNQKKYLHAFPYYQRLLASDLGEDIWKLYLNGAYAAMQLAKGEGKDKNTSDIIGVPVEPLSKLSSKDYYKIGIGWLERVLQYQPNHERATSLLASTYLWELNDCKNGVLWYTKVNELNPNDCEALRSLGYAYFGGICTKNYSKAINYLGKALTCLGGSPCKAKEIALWIGQAYHTRAVDRSDAGEKEKSRADFKKAFEWYNKVLECDPNNKDALQGREDVEFEF